MDQGVADRRFLKTAHDAINGKFGTDIIILDIRKLSILADYFIIATGGNRNQIKTIADELGEKLHKAGLTQKHLEGYQSANWVLLDFGSLIVHIFDKENRAFYNIERVWGDAPVVDIETLT